MSRKRRETWGTPFRDGAGLPRVFLRPFGAGLSSSAFTHGLRRGLHSFAGGGHHHEVEFGPLASFFAVLELGSCEPVGFSPHVLPRSRICCGLMAVFRGLSRMSRSSVTGIASLLWKNQDSSLRSE